MESGSRTFGLPGAAVGEILGVDELLPAPSARPAVRGIVPIRARLVPLVHLAAALDDAAPPAAMSATAVLVRGRDCLLALEVDETLDFVREDPEPVPGAWDVPWAAGVARHDGRLIPVVDTDVLVERVRMIRTGAAT